jgi:hypothetical protein
MIDMGNQEKHDNQDCIIMRWPVALIRIHEQENCKVVNGGVALATRCVNNRTARAVSLRGKQALQFH